MEEYGPKPRKKMLFDSIIFGFPRTLGITLLKTMIVELTRKWAWHWPWRTTLSKRITLVIGIAFYGKSS